VTQARRRPQSASPPAIAHVHTRRAYADGRNGQLHLTTAYPSGGGFDERTAVVCLHPEAATGTWFKSLLPELGRERSVYAPDLPAHGYSDPAPGTAVGLADHIAAIGDFLDSMHLRAVDLVGHQLGALIAAELAVQRPQQVRRVVMVSLPEQVPAALAAASTGARPAPAASKPASVRLAAITQQTLLLYPADAPANVKRLEPVQTQHAASVLAQRTDELYGAAAPELARLLRAFLDR
jgi:pimeloyl-ACP methyl ester carboxylesterase